MPCFVSLCDGLTCRVSTPECDTGNASGCYESLAVLDIKWYSQFNALLNMLRTLFIVLILAVGVFVFNRDASNLVLVPIERMLKRVKDVSENPLASKQVPSYKLALSAFDAFHPGALGGDISMLG